MALINYVVYTFAQTLYIQLCRGHSVILKTAFKLSDLTKWCIQFITQHDFLKNLFKKTDMDKKLENSLFIKNWWIKIRECFTCIVAHIQKYKTFQWNLWIYFNTPLYTSFSWFSDFISWIYVILLYNKFI